MLCVKKIGTSEMVWMCKECGLDFCSDPYVAAQCKGFLEAANKKKLWEKVNADL